MPDGAGESGSRPGGSIQFTYDRSRRLRTALFSGDVNDFVMLGAYHELVAHPNYDAGADDLVDLSGVSRLSATPAGFISVMALFADIDRLGIPTRLAILAPSDAVFGVSRMYQMLRGDEVPEEVQVFRDRAEAMRWLPRRESHEPAKAGAV